MLSQVWKMTLPLTATPIPVTMHAGAQILSFQLQNGVPTIWVKVQPGNKRVTRIFYIIGTGQEFDGDNMTYIGTVQAPHGLVWHLFERTG